MYVEALYKNGTSTGKSKILKSGEMTIIRADNTISEFVEDENHEEVRKIDYHNLPVLTAKHLGEIMDSGRQLSVTKELLFDVVGITEHKFVAYGEYVDATCDEEGYQPEICEICGAENKGNIEPEIPHEYIYEEHEGTCDKPGYISKVCIFCGEVEEKTVTEVKEHEYGEWKIVKEATTTEAGIRVAVCKDCGEELTETIKKIKDKKPSDTVSNNTVSQNVINEKPQEKKPAAPTIEMIAAEIKNESDNSSSSSDSSSNDDSSTDPCAAGHDFTVNVDEQAATCGVDGYKYAECSRCGTPNRITYSATGAHTPSSYGGVDMVDHQYTCDICGERVTEAHVFSGYESAGDASNHYPLCALCSTYDRSRPTPHNIPQGGGIVVYVDNSNHRIGGCTDCGYSGSLSNHSDTDIDHKCDTCGTIYHYDNTGDDICDFPGCSEHVDPS